MDIPCLSLIKKKKYNDNIYKYKRFIRSDPWSSDSMEEIHLTYEQLLLDKFLTEDSFVLSIYESEVSFG